VLPNKKMFKVMCPIERKDGSTFWMRVGSAFPNKDDSVNVYLDVLPANQKLQLRELTEDDLRERDQRRGARPTSEAPRPMPAATDSLPF
jgi:hypothetical protein